MTSRFVTKKRIAAIYDVPDEVLEPCALTMPWTVEHTDIPVEVRTLATTIAAWARDSEGLQLFIARKHNRFIERLEAVGYIISQEPEAETIETLSGEMTVILRVKCTPGGVTEVDKQVREDCYQLFNPTRMARWVL